MISYSPIYSPIEHSLTAIADGEGSQFPVSTTSRRFRAFQVWLQKSGQTMEAWLEDNKYVEPPPDPKDIAREALKVKLRAGTATNQEVQRELAELI